MVNFLTWSFFPSLAKPRVPYLEPDRPRPARLGQVGRAWPGEAWPGTAWLGEAWPGEVWFGPALSRLAKPGWEGGRPCKRKDLIGFDLNFPGQCLPFFAPFWAASGAQTLPTYAAKS